MDRVHYRRVMPSRLKGDYGGSARKNVTRQNRTSYISENEEPTTVETVILQCIVSGILVICVLIISLLNIGPTIALRDGLRQVLAGAGTAQELVADVRNFGEEFLGWGPMPQETEIETQPLPTSHPHEINLLDINSLELNTLELNSHEQNFPNDEIQFSEIPATSTEYNFPLTAIDEVSNPQIPGPSAVPGLWD